MKSLYINNTKYRELLEFPVPSKILEYIKLTEFGIEFYYRNQQESFSIPYSDVISMKLMIIGLPYSVRGAEYCVKKIILKLTFFRNNKKNTVSLLNENYRIIDTIFEIVYFSKFIREFSYSFKNNIEHSLMLNKAIKSYIDNNYKHTFYSFDCTSWALPIEILIVSLLLSLLFLIFYLKVTMNLS